jgi:hypothetical protein
LGGVLQTYLDSVGERITVGTDQQDRQRWSSTVSNNASFTVQAELGPKAPGVSVGFYNASATSPTLYEVFPSAAVSGWFAVLNFRTAPVRAVVNVFDESASLQGTLTYLGADRNAFGFYLHGSDGVFYTEDDRNPGGQAQFIVFDGTGVNMGNWWIAGEQLSVAGGGSDQQYFDAVLFTEPMGCSCPAQACTWGALKERFR